MSICLPNHCIGYYIHCIFVLLRTHADVKTFDFTYIYVCIAIHSGTNVAMARCYITITGCKLYHYVTK